jgi:hypothetical protein
MTAEKLSAPPSTPPLVKPDLQLLCKEGRPANCNLNKAPQEVGEACGREVEKRRTSLSFSDIDLSAGTLDLVRQGA